MTRRFFPSTRLICWLATILLGMSSLPLLAHTDLEERVPAADAVLQEAPEQLVLKFGAAVNLVKLSLTREPDQTVNLDFKPATRPARNFELPLPALAGGQYQVEWRALGADGHLLQGKWQFTLE